MLNQIPKNWQVQPLNFFTDRVTYGFTNPMPTSETGPFMVTAKDIINGRINYESCRKTTVSAYEKLLTEKSRPDLEDVLLTKDGTLGRVALVTQVPLCINQSVALIKINKDKILPIFLKYLLESPEYQKRMLSEAGGSTIGHIYITRVDKMEIAIPSKPEQEKIVNYIGSLDYKIELNNKISKTLERIARTLFKEWFVNFRFNGYEKAEFVDSELGKIPKEWKVGFIKDVGKVITGKTPSTEVKENFGSEIPFITIPDMDSVFITRTERYLSEKGSKKMQNMLLPTGSICVSCIATVGLVGITTQQSLTNQQINSVIPNKEELTYFLYIYLKNKKKDLELFGSGGTATLIINKTKFENLDLIIPNENILRDFHSIIEPMYEKILSVINENQKLAALRDLLLPKLMRGEIGV